MDEKLGDRELREAHDRLRGEVESDVPTYGHILARARDAPGRRPSWSRRTRTVPLTAAAAVTLALVVWLGGLLESDPTPDSTELVFVVDLSSIRWAAPTDFLLETPGKRLLRLIPEVGGPGVPLTVDRSGDSTANLPYEWSEQS